MTSTALTAFTLVGLAPFVGSFAGTLALRMPQKRPVILGRSTCDHCDAVLGPSQLVPLLSWASQSGRCHHCRHRISYLYPVTELLAVLIAGWALSAGTGPIVIVSSLLGWILLALSVMDIQAYILDDRLVAALFLGGLAVTRLVAPDRLSGHAIAAGAGFALISIVAIAYRRLRNRDGIGLGDAKFLGAAGMWVGLPGLPGVLLIASAAALAFAAGQIVMGQRLARQSMLPFGPFLALGLWFTWLYGPLQLGWQ